MFSLVVKPFTTLNARVVYLDFQLLNYLFGPNFDAP